MCRFIWQLFVGSGVLTMAGPAFASYLGFESPVNWTRGTSANSTYQEWNVFTSVRRAAKHPGPGFI
jgi:hypothetical protein